LGRLRDLTEVTHRKVVDVAWLYAMPARQRLRHLPDGRLHPRLIHGLDIDLIDIANQARLQTIGIGRRRIYPVVDLLLTRRSDAQNFALRRCERNHHKVVLIGTEGRLSFRLEDADDAHGYAFDLHDRPDWILIGAKKLARDGLAKHYDQSCLALIV